MALTMATPSRLLSSDLDCSMVDWMFEALTPPIQTVGTETCPAAARADRILRMPVGPRIDVVSFLLLTMRVRIAVVDSVSRPNMGRYIGDSCYERAYVEVA